MKPLSNTDTIASARGLSSPLTLIRISAFRGSETSCIDLAMPRLPAGLLVGRAARTDVEPPHHRELRGHLIFNRAHDRLHLTRRDLVLEIDRQHGGDLIGGAVYGQHF